MKENFQKTYDHDSVFSEFSEDTFNSEIPNVELNEGDTYSSEETFIIAVKTCAKQQGFQVRLGKIEKNAMGQIRKRTIVCNREGFPDKNLNDLNKRNCISQRCNCEFRVRASLNSSNGLWYLISVQLEHNHSMVSGIFHKFMSEEKIIPIEVQERILLLRRVGCNVPTIRAILKEEFSDIELEHLKSQDNEFCYEVLIDPETNEFRQAIWMFPEQRINYCRFYDVVIFDNTYKTNRFGMPFGIFTEVNNYGQIFLTDEDQAIIKAVDLIFQPHGTKHALCLWYLMKNVVKNLNGILGFKWVEFIKFFYQCINNYDENDFLKKWEQLKTNYPSTTKYLRKMDKNLTRWAPCYNKQIFMADMSTTQRGESMNSLMRGYMDATTSLINFLKAFESALEQRKEDADLAKFCEDNKVVSLLTAKEIPYHLFPIRWQKDPDDNILVKMYKTFYNNTEEIGIHGQIKAKPETAKNFYFLLDKSVKEEISLYASEKTSQNNEKIKNPATLKSKGRVSKRRIKSQLETAKPSKRPALTLHQQNISQTSEVKKPEEKANNSQTQQSQNKK
ncbi:13524_t:CDS:2 [Funneliformis caledonium]|uniref:13524_t:CDS:1 n=1 Tax=Funneliformis caledonium TaxID=1117310 RepID=A0A9N9I7Q3_9GLOM|nr:13524_t:CDS:2 [Funneliformis caledonium]